ncbi:MAG: hypothetical protein ACOX1S_05340 [Anaerostipes sp.]|nr:hypothetical protein [Anaerostipes sp.]
MLNELKEKIESFGYPVEYGQCMEDYDTWDYFVFGRRNVSKERNDFKTKYFVAIVRENFIPENFEIDVIKKVEEIKGLKFTNEAMYEYTKSRKTDHVVEILVLEFAKIKRSC